MLAAFAIAAALQADPAYLHLEQAFQLLSAKDYDQAIAAFQKAAAASPNRADIRKNLAYALMRVGETTPARDEFERALESDPNDHHLALEYAFLCHETGKTREARNLFNSLRMQNDPDIRATAEQAFQNIDRPLAEGIARWTDAVAQYPQNFSAHLELARTLAKRSQFPQAAHHFEAAWRLRPDDRALLIELAQAWRESGRPNEALSALIAASRAPEPRAAERARALLPPRYPYVYEFRLALDLDPANLDLRRELAYLLLEMKDSAAAEAEFSAIVTQAPADLLSTAQLGFLLLNRGEGPRALPLLRKVLADPNADDELADRVRSVLGLPKALRKRPEIPKRQVVAEARDMAQRSYDAGYLKDALKYLAIAHENDPLDFSVMLNLGRTHNQLKDDKEAVKWFEMAAYAEDPSVAGEAMQATRNLKPSLRRARLTAWALPFYSSRWNNTFTYGQIKTDLRIANIPIRPYLSTRFVGDTRGTIDQPYPQYLSETAFILGAGAATNVYKGLMGWAEAGVAVSYLNRRDQESRTRPDYRAGVSYSRGWGRLQGTTQPGLFWENHEDAVWVSRFDNTILFYFQNKLGLTFPVADDASIQVYWNGNLTIDAKRQYWANFADTGPGLRLRWPGMPPGMYFSIDLLRGAHLVNKGNPRRPNYTDFRAGFWYAITK